MNKSLKITNEKVVPYYKIESTAALSWKINDTFHFSLRGVEFRKYMFEQYNISHDIMDGTYKRCQERDYDLLLSSGFNAVVTPYGAFCPSRDERPLRYVDTKVNWFTFDGVRQEGGIYEFLHIAVNYNEQNGTFSIYNNCNECDENSTLLVKKKNDRISIVDSAHDVIHIAETYIPIKADSRYEFLIDWEKLILVTASEINDETQHVATENIGRLLDFEAKYINWGMIYGNKMIFNSKFDKKSRSHRIYSEDSRYGMKVPEHTVFSNVEIIRDAVIFTFHDMGENYGSRLQNAYDDSIITWTSSVNLSFSRSFFQEEHSEPISWQEVVKEFFPKIGIMNAITIDDWKAEKAQLEEEARNWVNEHMHDNDETV